MAVDEAAGGWGASELELALIAEPFGRAVASAPVIEAQVAARLLAQVRRGRRRSFGQGPRWRPAGHLRAARRTRWAVWGLCLPGAVADEVIALAEDGCCWCRSVTATARAVENLGSMPLADIKIGDRVRCACRRSEARDMFSGCPRPVAHA